MKSRMAKRSFLPIPLITAPIKPSSVFMQTNRRGKMQIIYAQAANQYPQDADPRTRSGASKRPVSMSFPRTKRNVRFYSSGLLAMPLVSKEGMPREQKVKAVSTEQLIHSGNPEEIAELQWRLTAPFSTILLALLGVRVEPIFSSAGEIRQSAPGDFSFCRVLQPERNYQEMGRAGGCGQHTRNLVDTGAFGWLAAGAFVEAILAISPAQPIIPGIGLHITRVELQIKDETT